MTALLTILGFSVHDTIVVFDRIRENLRKAEAEGRMGAADFEQIVGKSLDETYGRSLATSFAIFLVLASLFWYGADATRYFALTLLIGVIAGTYSSICLASPLLVPAVPNVHVVDPTGAGDAFRAGFLYGYLRHWDLLACAQLGSTVATYTIELSGTQTHTFTLAEVRKKHYSAYGTHLPK